MYSLIKDLTGRRFSRLLVLKDSGKRAANGNVIWLCRCDCGNFKEVKGNSLITETTKSCGCFRRERSSYMGSPNFKHGDGKGVRIYRIWCHIINRCYNSRDVENYQYYGKKGIKVCDEWRKDYLDFKKWALNSGYQENLTIDRINSKGNYEPNNCQWLTNVENVKKSQRERKEKSGLFKEET